MTGSYREHRDRWETLSEIDYLSAFIKAWLAFNAYYRDAYTDTADRDIIDNIKNSDSSNPIRSYFVPLIDNTTSEAQIFRAHIGELHRRLENYMLYSGKGDKKIQVSMRNVLLRTTKKSDKDIGHKKIRYKASSKFNNKGKLTSTSVEVIDLKTGVVKISLSDQKYDKRSFTADPSFSLLSAYQQGYLISVYDLINPYDYADLTDHHTRKIIRCGETDFKATPEDVFAGLVETIYTLRCLLFHGELNPNAQAASVYEPAYFIVRQFLSAVK